MAKKRRVKGDSIGKLFRNESAQATAGTSTNTGCLPVIVVLLAVILLGFSWSKFVAPDGGGDDHREDQHGQRDDQSAGKSGYLIFVHERSELSAADADTLDMADAFCEAHPGLEWRSVDDDDPTDAVQKLVAFADSKGVKPPCVVYKLKDNTLRSAAKWPTSEADLKGVLSKR